MIDFDAAMRRAANESKAALVARQAAADTLRRGAATFAAMPWWKRLLDGGISGLFDGYVPMVDQIVAKCVYDSEYDRAMKELA